VATAARCSRQSRCQKRCSARRSARGTRIGSSRGFGLGLMDRPGRVRCGLRLLSVMVGCARFCGLHVGPALTYPDPMYPSLDHIVPVSEGGTNDVWTLQLAHTVCNQARGNRGGGLEQLAMSRARMGICVRGPILATVSPTAVTGNRDSTNTVDTGAGTGPVWLKIKSTARATPTVMVTLRVRLTARTSLFRILTRLRRRLWLWPR
jgi:5-methylcytosine-specific restriction endonuclease McrA